MRDSSDEELLLEIRETVRRNNKILNRGKRVKMIKHLIILALIVVGSYYGYKWYQNNTMVIEDLKTGATDLYADGQEAFETIKELSTNLSDLLSTFSNNDSNDEN